jgi:hypothetical protein
LPVTTTMHIHEQSTTMLWMRAPPANKHSGGILFSWTGTLTTGESEMNLGFQILVGLLSVSLFVFCDYIITRWVELIETEGYWS